MRFLRPAPAAEVTSSAAVTVVTPTPPRVEAGSPAVYIVRPPGGAGTGRETARASALVVAPAPMSMRAARPAVDAWTAPRPASPPTARAMARPPAPASPRRGGCGCGSR